MCLSRHISSVARGRHGYARAHFEMETLRRTGSNPDIRTEEQATSILDVFRPPNAIGGTEFPPTRSAISEEDRDILYPIAGRRPVCRLPVSHAWVWRRIRPGNTVESRQPVESGCPDD